MQNPGPDIEALTHRLADTPAEFLAEPRIARSGAVCVPALVNDLLFRHGARASAPDLARFDAASARADRNRLALVMVAVWLLADEWFGSIDIAQADLLEVLDGAVRELAAATPAHKCVSDPDRREELARLALARLNLRPAGESEAQASDRLSAISGVERKRLLEASRAAEQRAREIREALARKLAEESADKWSRE